VLDLYCIKNDDGKFNLQFSCEGDNQSYCNVPTRMFCVGDLKFYAQMLGRDNMSASWCMWCLLGPNDWKSNILPEEKDLWTIDKLKMHALKVTHGFFKSPSEICGVVDYAVLDFIDFFNFIYPVLHGEIGFANAALDGFYDVLDDKIESMTVD